MARPLDYGGRFSGVSSRGACASLPVMHALLSLVLLLTAAEAASRPAPGDVAPGFSLQSTTGGSVSLADFKGKKTVVLAFFPKAFTGG